MRNRRWRKLKLHSKLMLLMTPALLLAGTLMFWLLEHNNPGTLGKAGVGGQLLAAFFQSASARTAGFNTIDIGQMTPATLLFLMMLMFIGAGATSTGGGIKVTTFAVVLLATKAFLTKRPHVTAFGRTLSPQNRDPLAGHHHRQHHGADAGDVPADGDRGSAVRQNHV